MSFITRLWDHIKQLFGSLPHDLKVAIHIGVTVVDAMKTVLDSGVTDVLTAIIPGDIDDKVKDWLRAKIPTILIELKLADQCAGLTDPNEITACALGVLQKIDGDVKNAFFHSLSVMIAQVAADGKLTWSDGVYLLEWYNTNKNHPEVAVQVGA